MHLPKLIENLNQNSLTPIRFYKPPLINFAKTLEFRNLIFAGDGLYLAIKNNFGISISRTDIDYANSALPNMDQEEKDRLVLLTPKPDLIIFNKILEMFKYVCGKTSKELMVNLYYDTIQHRFAIDICRQIVTQGSVNYLYSADLEFHKNINKYVRFLQIHSHNTMRAEFSSTDRNDEKNTLLGFYGVVGGLYEGCKYYDAGMKFRYWNGFNFVEVSFGDVFECNDHDQELTDNEQLILNSILQKSKEEEAKRFSQYGLPVSFPGKFPLQSKTETNISEIDEMEGYGQFFGIF